MSKAAKKKGKAKKGAKKGKKKEGDGLEMSLDEQFKRTTQEVDCLKEQLADRQEQARVSLASEKAMREKMMSARAMVSDEQQSKKDLTFDLTRQYKTLQLQSELKIQSLEAKVKRLTEDLDQANNELLETKRERDMLKEEKEREVSALHNKLDVMQTSYEAIIQEAFDTLASHLENSRDQWDMESHEIEGRNRQLLSKFGVPGAFKHRPSTRLNSLS